MKRIVLVLCLMLLPVGAGAGEMLEYVPKSATVVFQLRHLDTAPAWQDILDLYRGKLAKQNDPNLVLLSYILRQFRFSTIVGGYSRGAQLSNNILALEPQLTGQGEQFNKFLVENLGSFVAVDQNWQKKEVAGAKIYFDSRGESNEKLTSFSVAADQIILASNSDLIGQCLVAAAKHNSVTGSAWYLSLANTAMKDYDGAVFINNQGREFTSYLKTWEQNNKMVVLLSKDWIDTLGFSFSFSDGNRLRGRIVFQCSQLGKVPLVKSDAEFLGEAAKRRYSAGQLDIKSKVTVNGTRVTMDFEAVNWRPIFEQEMH